MSTTITVEKVPLLLRQIAACRTEGKPWPEVAQCLKMTVDKVRELVWEHEAIYAKILKRARKALVEDCFLDAVRALQQQTKSANEKIRQVAAAWLTRIWMAQLPKKARPQAKKAVTPSQPAPTPPPSPAIVSATPSIPAISPAAPASQSQPVKTISSDEVLKWLNEKKV